MSDKNKAILIIPVYNGRDSILKLIQHLESIESPPVLVMDDGSTDGLQEVIPDQVRFLRHPHNKGKGAALKTGLTHARTLGFEYAITLDADGQHDPLRIPEFLEAARHSPRSLTIGKRDLVNHSMPFHRKFSNNVTSLMLSLRCGLRIYDSQVGYRCYPLNDSRLWDSIESGFQFESAVFMNAARLRIPLLWIPIPVIYGSEASHIHLVKDTLRFIRTFGRSFMC